jgi:hypothetical protein
MISSHPETQSRALSQKKLSKGAELLDPEKAGCTCLRA